VHRGAGADADADAGAEARAGARGGGAPAPVGNLFFPAGSSEVLHEMSRQRLGELSRDDEMAVGVATCDAESALCLILALAWAHDEDEARDALYETASDFLHGRHPWQIDRAERVVA
jgi:hypothetical protein